MIYQCCLGILVSDDESTQQCNYASTHQRLRQKSWLKTNWPFNTLLRQAYEHCNYTWHLTTVDAIVRWLKCMMHVWNSPSKVRCEYHCLLWLRLPVCLSSILIIYTVTIAIMHWCFNIMILLKFTSVVKLCFFFPLATNACFDSTVVGSMWCALICVNRKLGTRLAVSTSWWMPSDSTEVSTRCE